MSKLFFLGTGNAFGPSGRFHSCYIIKGEKTILLDAGFTTFQALKSNNFSSSDIDIILLSHLHPDHYMFLPQMVLEDYYVTRMGKNIPVYGPLGTEDIITKITSLIYNEEVLAHINDIYSFYEYGVNEIFEIPGGTVETLPATHSPESRMQIININGKSIGYTGDTSLVMSSFEKLLLCDIVITEATSYGHKIPDHISVAELQELNISKEKRVYLSHVGQSVVDSADLINPPLYLAFDGMKIDI